MKNHKQNGMVHIALCDDQSTFIEEFTRQLTACFNRQSVSFSLQPFSDGQSLLDSQEHYDIIFLDIQMDKLSGLDTAHILRRRGVSSPIIFLTAYKQYVFDAFDVGAFHYLVKPIDPNKLQHTINQLSKQLIGNFTFKTGETVNTVPLHEILYIEVMDRKILLHTAKEMHEFYGKLQQIEAQVSTDFFRCHRSYLVNLNQVSGFDKTSICLSNKESIPLSKRKYRIFSTAFFAYLRKDHLHG